EFVGEVLLLALAVEGFGGFQPVRFNVLADALAGLAIFDDEKIPRLHEADRAGVVRRGEDAREDIRRNRIRPEAADIAPAEDGLVEALFPMLGELVVHEAI